MRRFSAAYLADTRQGLWRNREALEPLKLGSRERILDVGCGAGSLASVLREETDGEVVCLDADRSLLHETGDGGCLQADATRLPVADGTFDLVACQALLVNLRRPAEAVRAFHRASSDLVAAIEPDNGAVTLESTVPAEAPLAARARAAYLDGLDTDASLGAEAAAIFESVGLTHVTTARHDLVRTVEPPYEPRDLEGARRRAAATQLVEHEQVLRTGGLSASEFDQLVSDWRAMGREAAEQLRAGDYYRIERVPFYVSVGQV